ELAPRRDHRLARGRAVGDRLPAHDEIDGARVARPFALAAPRLAVDDLQPGGAREARNDLVLDLEHVGAPRVEALGPELDAGLRVDELGVDPHALAVDDDAARDRVSNVEVAADLHRVDRLALVGEGG